MNFSVKSTDECSGFDDSCSLTSSGYFTVEPGACCGASGGCCSSSSSAFPTFVDRKENTSVKYLELESESRRSMSGVQRDSRQPMSVIGAVTSNNHNLDYTMIGDQLQDISLDDRRRLRSVPTTTTNNNLSTSVNEPSGSPVVVEGNRPIRREDNQVTHTASFSNHMDASTSQLHSDAVNNRPNRDTQIETLFSRAGQLGPTTEPNSEATGVGQYRVTSMPNVQNQGNISGQAVSSSVYNPQVNGPPLNSTMPNSLAPESIAIHPSLMLNSTQPVSLHTYAQVVASPEPSSSRAGHSVPTTGPNSEATGVGQYGRNSNLDVQNQGNICVNNNSTPISGQAVSNSVYNPPANGPPLMLNSLQSVPMHIYAQVLGSHGQPSVLIDHLNIMPSMDSTRINNTNRDLAMAEQQLSFMTFNSPMSGGPPGFNNPPTLFQRSPGMTAPGTTGRSIPVSQMNQLGFPDNSGFTNISQLGAAGGQLSAPNIQGSLASSSSNNRFTSFTTLITSETLVRLLPQSILKYIASRLEIQTGSNWKDLVELHGWNWEDTFYFDQRRHQEGPFYSLLNEPDFQDYSVGDLNADLFKIPRKDVLRGLDKQINEFNDSVCSGQRN